MILNHDPLHLMTFWEDDQVQSALSIVYRFFYVTVTFKPSGSIHVVHGGKCQ